MKNGFKKFISIASFWLLLSSFVFGGSFSYYEGGAYSYSGNSVETKDNSELNCTTYRSGNSLYIVIKFKKDTPNVKHLKKILEGAKKSIDSADNRLDKIYDRDMQINYIFYGEDGSPILSARYCED